MKITESQLKSIITKVIKESLEGFEQESDYAKFGNRNIFDDHGQASMAAQGDDYMAKVAKNDTGKGFYNPYDEEGEVDTTITQAQDEPRFYHDVMEAKIRKIVRESLLNLF